MTEPREYNELVKQALQGNKDALPVLAENIYTSLRSYIFRITLSEDLTDDIVQETILEMYKIFGQLRNGDRFWPWICKIALNKIRSQSRTQTRQKHLLQQHAEELAQRPANLDGLASVINDEIKQSIFHAVLTLNDQQKAVLSMRCYEDMPYSQIADVMGMSELGVRILFHRAKKKLQKQFSKFGLGKKSVIMALIVFGKMTAPTEAAAAQIAVTASTLTVGTLAATAAAITTKTAIALSVGGIITLGVAANVAVNKDHNTQTAQQTTSPMIQYNQGNALSGYTDFEGYYYYPAGSSGPVMMRLSASIDNTSYQALQNDNGNYLLENMGSSVTLRNARYWNSDLSVMTLPTDDPQLEAFVAGIENRSPHFSRPIITPRQLLVVASENKDTHAVTFAVQNYDALMEERFQYNWPAKSTVVDLRDAVHRQGWCYFSIDGFINEQTISGLGRIPFLHSMSKTNPAWIKLKIGDAVELWDSGKQASLKNASGVTLYPGSTFFVGLNKPWMGFHCIDSVRRDAAINTLPYQTQITTDNKQGSVSIAYSGGTIDYTLNMEQDLIEKITLRDGFGKINGEITFTYSQTIPAGRETFTVSTSSDSVLDKSQEHIHWLVKMASGSL